MSTSSSGKLIAHWYVFCNLCGRGGSHYRPRVILHTKVEQIFLKKGWRCVNKRWVCPDCDANAKRFLDKCQTLDEELRKRFRKAKS